ncbi:ABC transporter substrate-binding protein [Microtetraspora niveoalba]|uniref:ABC transporter substrate-binding protein n=1 Tax=Microtetraspora niveoalba TaxID=46175 RepID=UPI0008330D6F|nr:ABC transporter substrate-binding protein [Microtetraspora niveoalba]
MTRSPVAAALVAAAVTAIASCAPAAPAERAPQKEVAPGFAAVADTSATRTGEATVQLDYDTAEADGLDPQTAQWARTWMLTGLSYETLVTTDEKFAIVPELATSWTTPDDRTYVFTLDPAATFSNGRKVTADDVVGSLERLREGGGVWSGQLGPVSSVEATDASTVTVKLAEPYAPFLAALANTPAAVLPMKEVNAGTIDLKKQMVGSGPYVATQHRQDKSWTFERNPSYRHADQVKITKLTVDIVPQDSTRMAALREGSAQIANFNNADAIDLLADSPKTKVFAQKQSDYFYLLVNSRRPGSPLADEKVRFAINAAIDRRALVDVALGGESAPTAAAPSNLPGGCAPAELPSAKAGPGKAAGLLAESGAKNVSLNLLIDNSEPVLAQLAQVIQQQLAQIGVTVKIEQYDVGTYEKRVLTTRPGEFDLAIGWFVGYVDASMVTRWWNPKLSGFTSGFAGDHADLDALIAKAQATGDESARAAALTELCASADRHSEIVPLVHRPSFLAVDTSVVSPTVQSDEGYGDFLRHIADFRLLGK